jgi:hypothetical protein
VSVLGLGVLLSELSVGLIFIQQRSNFHIHLPLDNLVSTLKLLDELTQLLPEQIAFENETVSWPSIFFFF